MLQLSLRPHTSHPVKAQSSLHQLLAACQRSATVLVAVMTAAAYKQCQAAVPKQTNLHLQMLTLGAIALAMTQTVLLHGLTELAEVLIRQHAPRAGAPVNLKLQVCLPSYIVLSPVHLCLLSAQAGVTPSCLS